MNIIGISALYHDSSCALLKDNQLICAVQEERFTRKKNDAGIPVHSFLYCLERGGLDIQDIDIIAYYEDPVMKRERQLRFSHETDKIKEVGFVENIIRTSFGYEGKIEYHTHHLSHAASAYYISDFSEAAVLINDGVGEWATTSFGMARDTKIDLFRQIDFPHSLGLFYSTVTDYLGFKVNSGEYKVMGLAPYGKPKYTAQLRKMISVNQDGTYTLEMKYYDFLNGRRMFHDNMLELFGEQNRIPESGITQFHMDMASSVQSLLNEIVCLQADFLARETRMHNLCLAGGVALNCVGNRVIEENTPFRHVFIQPAAGDAGGALGAALLSHHKHHGRKVMFRNAYLGTEYDTADIGRWIGHTGLKYKEYDSVKGLCRAVADIIRRGYVAGWFQGRMEYGPRALGSRSILADPRDPAMRDRINKIVKKREMFRPFAPVVMEEHMAEHFDCGEMSPYMLKTCKVVSPIDLPAVTHVDQSARLQTVSERQNKELYQLLRAFYEMTGCPVLLNTSFNMRGEPIVENPLDAVRCFFLSSLDYLVIGNYVIEREENKELIEKYVHLIERLDLPKGSSSRDYNIYTFI